MINRLLKRQRPSPTSNKHTPHHVPRGRILAAIKHLIQTGYIRWGSMEIIGLPSLLVSLSVIAKVVLDTEPPLL